MKWKYETQEQEDARLGKWHKWFAWYPVRYDGNFYWLQYIERRINRFWIMWDCIETIQYRDINSEETK